jgi:hypothetical protein
MPDYAGDFDPDFTLEDLSHRALVLTLQEFATQSHLLSRSFLLTVGQRLGDDVMREIADIQWTGIAGLTADRLRAATGVDGDDDAPAIATIFRLHPCFQPRTYVDLRVDVVDERHAVLAFGPCPAFDEDDPYSWFAQVGTAPHPALDAIARAVNPRARCHPKSPPDDARFAWDVVIDPDAEPAEEDAAVRIVRGSRGASLMLSPPTRRRGAETSR